MSQPKKGKEEKWDDVQMDKWMDSSFKNVYLHGMID